MLTPSLWLYTAAVGVSATRFSGTEAFHNSASSASGAVSLQSVLSPVHMETNAGEQGLDSAAVTGEVSALDNLGTPATATHEHGGSLSLPPNEDEEVFGEVAAREEGGVGSGNTQLEETNEDGMVSSAAQDLERTGWCGHSGKQRKREKKLDCSYSLHHSSLFILMHSTGGCPSSS